MRVSIDIPTDVPAPDVHIQLVKCAWEKCSVLINPGKKDEQFHSEKCRKAYHNQRRKLTNR